MAAMFTHPYQTRTIEVKVVGSYARARDESERITKRAILHQEGGFASPSSLLMFKYPGWSTGVQPEGADVEK